MLSSMKEFQWVGIVVSFIAYMMVHAGRKAFTNTKSVAIGELGVSPTLAGSLDATFMLAYAFGLVALGSLGDKMSPIRLLALSLLIMGVLQEVFSELCIAGFAIFATGKVALFLVWILNGLVQSLAWPCSVKIVHSSMNGHSNGTVFSIWACCGIVGNVVCSLIAYLVMDHADGYMGFRSVFTITSIGNVLTAFLVYKLKITTPNTAPSENDQTGLVSQQEGSTATLSLVDCLKTRGVVDYSFCFACIKAVAYAMFFWLPFYLVSVHGVTAGSAAKISIAYDVATIFGGPICGYLVDKTQKPATIIAIFSALAAFPQLMINSSSPSNVIMGSQAGDGSVPTSVMISITVSGFLVGGVTNVLSAAVCARLGGHGSTSSITGIIDGAGSFGASATQIIIPLIGVGSGWDTVFWLLAGLLVMSAFTLVRIIRDEFQN